MSKTEVFPGTMKISQKVSKMGDIVRNVLRKTEIFYIFIYISRDCKKKKKKVRDRKPNFFFLKNLSKFPFETYIVLSKKYKM